MYLACTSRVWNLPGLPTGMKSQTLTQCKNWERYDVEGVWKKLLQPSLYNANTQTHMQKCNFPPIKIWHRQIKLVCPANISSKRASVSCGSEQARRGTAVVSTCEGICAHEHREVQHMYVNTDIHIYMWWQNQGALTYWKERRGKSLAGIVLRDDEVGKTCKEDDINTRGLYESDKDNRGITVQKSWDQWTPASEDYSSAAHLSLLPDLFLLKEPGESCGEEWGNGKPCRFLSKAMVQQQHGWLW